jgi:pimeloyl-ACP methyl ester carboxylesterase
LLEDAPAIYDLVASRFPGRPIVAVGFSIGSGVAAHLARQRSLGGLILVTPFDSMAALARDRLPWLPVGLLLRHEMAVADELRAVSVPVVIITAGDDEIVPAARSAALAKAVPRLVLNRAIAGAGHNDIYHASGFREAMEAAADSLR